MKEKISRNKISGHYKSFFGLENMGLGENDNLMIDWGESLVNDFCNQEVEKRISERMPSEEDIELYASLLFPFEQPKSTNTHGDEFNRPKRFGFKNGVIWLRSRLTQKTEGGK